ncbi:MAG: amino acid permease [Bryobacterales bacterium]|nr:amino acid permease [Bryobacterales bacterium]
MVGTGIFGTTGFMVGQLGDAKIILAAWAVGSLFALAGAFSYSELGINFPSSGGEYVYLTRAFGPTWGFMTGWTSFFAGFSAPIAAAALTFSNYLGHFFPALREESGLTVGSGALTLKFGGAQWVASSLILIFTALNCFGVGRVAKIQNVLTGGKIVVIVLFVFGGFLYGNGSWNHLSEAAVRTSSTALPAQFVVTLLWVMVSYSGWNAATYVAEELKRPERTLPAALAVGTALVTALYLGLNLVFFYATPLEQMKDHIAVGSLAASNLFGPQVAGVFAGAMALSILSTVSAMVTIGPRVYYAMAQNGAFFRKAAVVHPKWRTPTIAILSQGACASLMTLTPFPQLVFFIGMSLTFFTVLSVASLFVFRRREGWQRLKPVSFCFPAIPAAYILVGGCMTIYGIIWQPKASFIALANIAAGAVIYRLWLRDRRL